MFKIIIYMLENWLNVDRVKTYIIEKAINLPLEGKIKTYIIEKAINLPLEGKIKTFVNEKYKKIAAAKLPIKTEIIKVKKGKSKYTITFFATKSGQLKFNFGRHLSNGVTEGLIHG